MAGVSSRTRSKNVPLFRSFSLGGSSKRRKSDEDDMGFDSASCSKKMKVKKAPFVVPKGAKVIFVEEDDDGNEGDVKMFDGNVQKEEGDEENPITIHSDEYGESDEQYSISSDSEYDADDVKDRVKSDKSGGNGEFSYKDKNFVDLDDSDEGDEEKFVDSDDDECESEENESTSDEDFVVDELNDISDKDDESSSDEVNESYDDEEEEEEEEEEEKKKKKKKKKVGRRYLNAVEKLAREAMDSGISEMNNEEVKDESPSSVNNEVEHSDYGSVATSTAFEKKGSFDSMKAESVENVSDGDGDVNVAKAKSKSKDKAKPNDSVNLADCDERKEKYVKGLGVGGVSSVQVKQEKISVENVSGDDINVVKFNVKVEDNAIPNESLNLCGDVNVGKSKVKVENNAKPNASVNVADSHEGKEQHVKGLGVETKKKGYRKDEFGHASVSSSKLNEVSERLKAKGVEVKLKNVSDESVNAKSKAKTKYNVGDSDEGKDQYVGLDVGGVSLVQTKQEKMENDSIVLEFKDDKVDRRDTQSPPVFAETTPSIWSFKKVEKVQKTKEEKENEVLWDESDRGLRELEAVSKNEASKELKAKSVNVAKAKSKIKDDAKPNDSVNIADCDEGKKQYVKGLDVGGVSSLQTKQEKMKESHKQKMVENNERDYKGRANICIEKKKESSDKNGLNQRVESTHFMRKELRSLELLAKYYLERKNTMKNDSIVLEVNSNGVDRQDTQPPPVSVKTPPERIWSLKKVEIVQKTKEQEEEEVLWAEYDAALREEEAVSKIGNLGTSNAAQEKNGGPSSRCEHDTFLDEEIGLICKLCRVVVTEIKYISELVIDRFPGEGSGRKASFDGVNVSRLDGSQFNVSNNDSETNLSRNQGTVWDLIPDMKQSLYPHQQEGFEFIWKNLAGNIELQKLKNADPCSEGGCIISHAPGTGKTRLTIVFLKAYLKAFPNCLPIIVAPAGILLTWEDEFKKWDIGVPFHNLSNPGLSGKEHADAVETFGRSNTQHGIDETRTAKLISWFKETSILGISYNLFGKKCKDKKKHESLERKGNCDIREILLKAPGLLVLDEGHTPRNQRSHIWKVLSKIQTQKRIILSGTPFQNNFWELYSTLSLVKPSFPNTIPPELKTFCQNQGLKSSKKLSWQPDLGNTTRDPSDDKIKKLKLLMDPFVHVHKGAILENKLPGLRECLVTLKADSLQNEILKTIKRSQNTIFNFERKIALTSVHPSLFLECALSKEEESVLDKDQLEKLRLNPHEGVKTKFLFDFVRLCDAFHEKVLVFSQFHAPLQLIKDQLNSAFKWSEGKEVLVMSGEDPPKVKQSLIHSFNDANCQAKVLLASTKACSEGISLVGASRVVLLDVVWNPSVERQAISRAYRIGQKKVVYTYHLLAEGTTEEEKYGKQAEKDRLSELVFSAKNAANNDDKSKTCAVNFEDRVLDEMTQHKNLKDIFVKCVVLRKERDMV